MIARSLAVVLLLAGCAPDAEREAEPGSTSEAPEEPPARAATVTPEQFRTIGWIEGTWRGTGGGVEPFYERYRFADDSTLVRHTFSDSTLVEVSDSTTIALRGGRVVDPAEDPHWQVTAFDSTSWRFASTGEAGRGFTWRRDAPDQWTAILTSPGANGQSQERVYTLTRIAP